METISINLSEISKQLDKINQDICFDTICKSIIGSHLTQEQADYIHKLVDIAVWPEIKG